MTAVTITGNLAYDPEVRFTPTGKQVAQLVVIENRRRPTDEGGWEDAEPNTFRVEVWGRLVENIVESCHKGDRLVVIGTIVTDRWEDRESGDTRSAQRVRADEVAFSLKFHTVAATKNTPRDTH